MRCEVKHPTYGQCVLEHGHEGKHQISQQEREAHRCHAKGCATKVKPEMLMCFKHWKMVPKKTQLKIWKHYRVGQCDDKRPSSEWLEAADEAIKIVYDKENSNK